MRRWWLKIIRRQAALRQLSSPGDVLLFVHIFFFVAVTPLLLRLQLPRLQSLLEPANAPSSSDPVRVEKIATYVGLALQTGKPLIRGGCLNRGLALYYFLRRAGLDVTLCFGLGDLDGSFVGHCWLVKNGEPFLEARDPRPLFAEVYRFLNGDRYATDAKL